MCSHEPLLQHSPLLLFCLILILSCKCTAEVECLQEERSSLVDLKNGFSFMYRDRLPSWAPDTNCCNWEGVTCDSNSGRIIGLDLSGRSISAANISFSLLNLTSLQTLNLAHNFFHGAPIPDGLGMLANLRRLNLSNAGFVGQIPAGVSRLTRLVLLDLSDGKFFRWDNRPQLYASSLETIVRNLTNLRELYLDSVNLSYDVNWMRTLSVSLPRLQVLSLSRCFLAGTLNKVIFQFKDLRALDLSQNDMLSGAIPECSYNNILDSLVLSYTNISGQLPDSISNLRRLTRLEIKHCMMMTGFLPSSIGNLSRLVHLDLSSNGFSGEVPFSMGKLANLKYLDLSANSFRGTILPTIFRLVQLQHVDLSANNFEGVISSSIANLTQLAHLDLRLNNFNGVVPSSVEKLAKFAYVDLSNNHLSGSLPSFSPSARIGWLALSNNNFQGQIPSSYSEFRYVRIFDVSFNSISGSVPAYLFSLPELQSLNLGHNQLSGELEEFLNVSTFLESIDLSCNQLQGQVPTSFFKLSGLRALYIASNNFSVELRMFESLGNLSDLDVSNNLVSISSIDGDYSLSFPNLNRLRLSSCSLTKVPAFLQHQDAMSSLDLSNNRIAGHIPDWIWRVGNGSLRELNLSCNQFTYIEGVSNLSFANLGSLDLHSNLLQGPIPLPSAPVPGLYHLDYSHNRFSSTIPPNLPSYFMWIDIFSLGSNFLTGGIPESICNLPSNVLDLCNNSLSGPIPQCLFDSHQSFLVLNLRRNQLQGSLPQSIKEGCALQTILLSDNRLEGPLPRSLVNCTDLLVFDVGNNNIVDSFPFWLGDMVNLKALILRGNGFYGHVGLPKDIELESAFSRLQFLDISSNKFNGSLSPEFLSNLKVMMNSSGLKYSTAGLSYDNASTVYQDPISVMSKGQRSTLIYQLTVLVLLDFSDNGFEGDIPEGISVLRGLQVLNFSRNAFTGKIPRSIGNLSQLESLDLSANHLSGEIPQEMTLLTFLAYLNLSENELAGRIPQGNQFSTFSNASFAGNQELCGSPLSKKCLDSGPNVTDTVLDLSSEDSTYLFGLILSVGFGFAVGMAGVILFQNRNPNRSESLLSDQ